MILLIIVTIFILIFLYGLFSKIVASIMSNPIQSSEVAMYSSS